MIRHETSMRVDRPLNAVFAFVNHFERMPEWVQQCVSLEQTSPGPREQGSQLRYQFKRAGKIGEMSGTITAYEPCSHLGLRFADDSFEVLLSFQFATDGSGTVLKHSIEIKPLRFLARLMVRMADKAVEQQLKTDTESLKKLLEAPSIRP